MAKNLFVGSLPWSVNDEQLAQIFAEAGTVDSARVITERDTGRSKGFGFVEMASAEEADAAIAKLHGSDHGGRNLTVNEARPMEPRTGGFGGGRGGDRGGDRGGRSGGFGGGRGGDRGGDRGGNRW